MRLSWVGMVLVTLGCPAFGLQLDPEDPQWREGAEAKVLRVTARNPNEDTLTVRVEFHRPVLGEAPGARGEGAATDLGDGMYGYTLTAEDRPDTYLRGQLVRYRWIAQARDKEGDPRPGAETLWRSFRVGCSTQQIQGMLEADQERNVEAFDGLDAVRLGTLGYVPTHGAAVLKGLGVTYYKPVSQFGEPHLLFFVPNGVLGQRLAGWGYAYPFDPLRWPRKACHPFEGWFVHEAGWHAPNGDFFPTPPGTVILPPSGSVWHGRIWDMHVWRRDQGTPEVAMFDGTLEQGAPEAPAGTFIAVPWTLP